MLKNDYWVILTTDRCPWCDRVKELLGNTGISYTSFDLTTQPLMRAFANANGLTSAPQVYHNGHLVGGYGDTEGYLKLLLGDDEEQQIAFNF